MRRAEKDYCNKGTHPRWRAWTARYDETAPTVVDYENCTATRVGNFIGEFCVYCGAKVSGAAAGGAPEHRAYDRLRILRGVLNKNVSQDEFEDLVRRSSQRKHAIRKIAAKLVRKGVGRE